MLSDHWSYGVQAAEQRFMRHDVPFNFQGYLPRSFVHHAYVTALLRSMTFGSMLRSCEENYYY